MNRVPPKLDGESEEKLAMIACSEPPEEHSSQPLALLGEQLATLNVVDSISRETVKRIFNCIPYSCQSNNDELLTGRWSDRGKVIIDGP